MRTPEDRPLDIKEEWDSLPVKRPAAFQYITDFERCDDPAQLRRVMEAINLNRYHLVSVTQDSNDIYTVFFRRCVLG